MKYFTILRDCCTLQATFGFTTTEIGNDRHPPFDVIRLPMVPLAPNWQPVVTLLKLLILIANLRTHLLSASESPLTVSSNIYILSVFTENPVVNVVM